MLELHKLLFNDPFVINYCRKRDCCDVVIYCLFSHVTAIKICQPCKHKTLNQFCTTSYNCCFFPGSLPKSRWRRHSWSAAQSKRNQMHLLLVEICGSTEGAASSVVIRYFIGSAFFVLPSLLLSVPEAKSFNSGMWNWPGSSLTSDLRLSPLVVTLTNIPGAYNVGLWYTFHQWQHNTVVGIEIYL